MSVAEDPTVRPDLEGTEDEELHELIQRAHEVELLTQHPGWPFFTDYLRSLTTHTQHRVLSGACRSFDEYKENTGFVRGLQAAMEAPKILLRRVSEMQSAREGIEA